MDDVARDRLEMLQAIGQAPLPLPCLSTPIAAAIAEEDQEDAIDESARDRNIDLDSTPQSNDDDDRRRLPLYS